jgi:perosamine synthetase
MSINEVKEPVRGSILGIEEIEAVARVLNESHALSRGPEIEKFERAFAEHLGVKYCVAVSSCTVALRLAFQSLNLKKGDHVIVPVNAFWNAVCYLIEKEVSISVVDLEKFSLTIDTNLISEKISKKTKAILSYSHGGNPSNMSALRKICNSFGITLIEDCAHGNGSLWKDKSLAHWSDISCFSFSTLKNMSTLGEGGMVATNSKKTYQNILLLRSGYPIGKTVKAKRGSIDNEMDKFLKPGDFYKNKWTEVESIGSKYVMTTPQAAVGLVQLKKLASFNLMRQQIASRYIDALKNIEEIKFWDIDQNSKCAWHLFHFFINSNTNEIRDAVVRDLRINSRIEVVNRFWPLSMNSVFVYKKFNDSCPNYENQVKNSIFSLPISPNLGDEEVNYILAKVTRSLKTHLIK